MAKRSCRRTNEENRNHEIAVKLRKMTDEKLVEYVGHIKKNEHIIDFIQALEAAYIPGIGKATITKVKDYADKYLEVKK